jgi:hypothetical protein
MSPTLINQKLTIPSISHAVSFEVISWYIYIRSYLQVLYV